MLDEVHRHQDEGRATFIVSAAGNDMVRQLAEVLGMSGGIGTAYEVGPDGLYTGRLDGPFVYGEGKVTAMEAYAAEHSIDLEESWAYSDSASDLPMLRAVGNAVVVNPDQPLLEVAKAEGWQVMRFERLGRKLAIGAAAAMAALAGTASRGLIARRREGRRLRGMRHR
jgi:phosphoserine phosphatase